MAEAACTNLEWEALELAECTEVHEKLLGLPKHLSIAWLQGHGMSAEAGTNLLSMRLPNPNRNLPVRSSPVTTCSTRCPLQRLNILEDPQFPLLVRVCVAIDFQAVDRRRQAESGRSGSSPLQTMLDDGLVNLCSRFGADSLLLDKRSSMPNANGWFRIGLVMFTGTLLAVQPWIKCRCPWLSMALGQPCCGRLDWNSKQIAWQ